MAVAVAVERVVAVVVAVRVVAVRIVAVRAVPCACQVRKDLVAVLEKLAARTKKGDLHLDAIIIETTGMADPAPVAQTFLVHEAIQAFARLDGIVTLVDAKHIERHLDKKKPKGVVNEAVAQVAFADRLLLNKVDLVSAKDLTRVEARLRRINHVAPLRRCERSEVAVENVLDICGFDLQRALEASPGLLDVSAPPTKHDASVTSVSLDQGAPRHLRTVLQGDLDLELTQSWFDELLQERGADMFRMKGVLSIAHAKQRFVYHAVHMTFEGSFAEPWGEDEPRQSKMVFIGQHLDSKELAESFNDCLATPESLQVRREALRFAVGDEVECKTAEDEWTCGTVHSLLYRADELPQGLLAPYQVALEDEGGHGHAEGRFIWVPQDDEEVIRSRRRRSGRLRGSGRGADDHVCDGSHDHAHSHGDDFRSLCHASGSGERIISAGETL